MVPEHMREPSASSQNFTKSFLFSACLFASIIVAPAAEPRTRIRGSLGDAERFELTGNLRPAIARAQDLGAVSGSTAMPRMSIHFALTPTQNADLLQLLELQQNRHSAQFHKWLTPEQFADRFGMNSKDIEKVTIWLESQGFTDVEAARSRNVISFSGTAAQVEAAFQTPIHSYALHGTAHIANATAPQLPKALRGMVAGIRGLHDFHPKPHGLHPHFTSAVSGNVFLTPDDFATIYGLQSLYGSGITGAGRSIVIPGQSDINVSDIEAFQTAAGRPVKDPQVILTGTDPGTNTGDMQESDLDLEWAGGIAYGASVIFVNSTDVFTSITYAVTNNVADVMPITYGNCEVETGQSEISTMNLVFQQANAEGMTVIAAAGDNGAADCDSGTATTTVKIAAKGLAVDYPASSPNVTGVGGTSFNEDPSLAANAPCVVTSAGVVDSLCLTYWNTTTNNYGGSAKAYIPEQAWNETSAAGSLEATGGGASSYDSKPSWQIGPGVPIDGHRDVPDVALDASPDHDSIVYCSGGSCQVGFRASSGGDLDLTGGTSAGSPSFGAIVALLCQKYNSRQGNINPNLYLLASITGNSVSSAQGSATTNAFNDIVTGSNIVPCTTGTPNCTTGSLGFSAGSGYDEVTGLGSVNANNLFEEWAEDFALTVSPSSLTLMPGTSGTASITVTPVNNFTGTVTFTCSVASALTDTTCSIPGTVTKSGAVTLTVSAGASAVAAQRRMPSYPISNGGVMVMLGGLLLAIGVTMASKRRHLQVCSATCAILLVAGLSSCGGGNSSATTSPATTTTITTSPITALVTVNATSGALADSTTISVTLQ